MVVLNVEKEFSLIAYMNIRYFLKKDTKKSKKYLKLTRFFYYTLNKVMRRKLLFLGLLAIFLLVGFYRLAITKEIGLALSRVFGGSLYVKTHKNAANLLEILASWADTVLYSLLHSLVMIGLVLVYFGKKTFAFYTFILLSVLFGFCVFFLLLHKATKLYLFYRISEDLIYTTLSPTPLLLLFAIFSLYPYLKKQQP
jgi:hypothetical protein